jgi:imidazolonepropionase-like amidohydrolase
MHTRPVRLLPTLLVAILLPGAVLPASSALPARARPFEQEPQPAAAPAPAPAASTTLYLHAERLILRPGKVIEGASVLVEGGKIRAIGTALPKPEGARVIEGKVICASFVDPWSGLCTDESSAADGDTTAATRAADGLDLFEDHHLCERALRSGVTVARAQAGAIAATGGKGAVVRVAPELGTSERVVREDAVLAAAIGIERGGRDYDVFDRLSALDKLSDQLEAGRKYREDLVEYGFELEEWQKKIAEKEVELDKEFKKAKKDREKEMAEAKEKGKEFKDKSYKEDKKPRPPKFDEDRAAFGDASYGLLPLYVLAEGGAEIHGVLQATAEYDRLRLVLVGGSAALPFADDLARRGIAVLLWPAPLSARTVGDRAGADLSLAAQLSAKGVEVLFGSGGQADATCDLPLFVALAVGHGFDREDAFEALTLGAARALDVGDRVGSVEVGKDAELLVLDGEPLAGTTSVRWVISAGQVVVQPEN